MLNFITRAATQKICHFRGSTETFGNPRQLGLFLSYFLVKFARLDCEVPKLYV